MTVKELYEKRLPNAVLNVNLSVRSTDGVAYCIVFMTKNNNDIGRIDVADLNLKFTIANAKDLLAALDTFKVSVDLLLGEIGFNIKLKDMEAVI